MEALVRELLVLVALVLVNGVFAGAEIAIVALRKTRLLELVQEGHKGAIAAQVLRDQPERFLATVQVGITVVGATAAAFGGATLGDELAPIIAQVPALAQYAHDLAIAVVVAGVSFLSIVLGELVPKSMALRNAERYALFIARPLLFLCFVARPFVWVLTAASNVVLRPFGDRTNFIEARLSIDELLQLVDEATKAGSLESKTGEIASRALTFGELTAADVMVPRNRIHGLDIAAGDEEIRRVLLEERHSRMPIFEGSLDKVVGYIAVKDVVSMIWERQLVVLHDLVRPAVFVPETAPVTNVLQTLQRRRTGMAMVVDEHGVVSGLLTLEDLMEEIVGEIFSERDEPHVALIERQPDGSTLVSGEVTIRDLNRALGLNLDEDADFSTVAGLAIALAGHIPGQGTKLQVPGGVELEVVDALPHQVRKLRLRTTP